MTLQEAIKTRHSVRKYTDKPIETAKVEAKTFSVAGYANIDLGIVKYHFEVGAGKDSFEWVI